MPVVVYGVSLEPLRNCVWSVQHIFYIHHSTPCYRPFEIHCEPDTMMTNILLILLLTSPLGSAVSVRIISTDRDQPLPDPQGLAELPAFSLAEYEDLTLCSRVFSYHFESSEYDTTTVMSIDNEDIIATTRQSDNQVFGSSDFSPYFPVWPPGEWNSACVVLNQNTGAFKININGENLVEEMFKENRNSLKLPRIGSYNINLGLYSFIFMMWVQCQCIFFQTFLQTFSGKFKQRNLTGLVLMNKEVEYYPHHGAITDLNVWSRALTDQEIGDWQHCKKDPEGITLSWDNLQFTVRGLNVSEIDRNETCREEGTKKFIASDRTIGFDKTERLCRALGGEIAVARDPESLERMSRAFEASCQEGEEEFYGGYRREDLHSPWTDVVTGDMMGWTNWDHSCPFDWYDDDLCAISYQNSSGKFCDADCSMKLCPVCQVNQVVNMELEGVCRGSSVDSFYVMKSPTEYLGYLHTSIAFSSSRDRWEVSHTFNSSNVLAFMDTKSDFPLGVNQWIFLEEDCADPWKMYRTLSLHFEVKKPGNFCCDDGICIDSELVCDSFSDCGDGSDENDCNFLYVPPTLTDTEKPPTRVKKSGKIQPIILNATFHVLEIFEINEVDSTFDLHFILEIQWLQQTLSYSFLKLNDFKNFLLQSSKEKIWIPRVEFSEIKEDLSSDKNDNVVVLRRGKPQLGNQPGLEADLEYYQDFEVYSGSENPLKIIMERRIIFSCSFDNINNFPFGKQKCSVMFYLGKVYRNNF